MQRSNEADDRNEAWQFDGQLTTCLGRSPSDSGGISVSVSVKSKLVVDTGHTNDVDGSRLSPMIAAPTESGHWIRNRDDDRSGRGYPSSSSDGISCLRARCHVD